MFEIKIDLNRESIFFTPALHIRVHQSHIPILIPGLWALPSTDLIPLFDKQFA